MPISAPSAAISWIRSGWRWSTTAGMKNVGAPSRARAHAAIVRRAVRVFASEKPNRVKTVHSRRVKLCRPLVRIEKETRSIGAPWFGCLGNRDARMRAHDLADAVDFVLTQLREHRQREDAPGEPLRDWQRARGQGEVGAGHLQM